MFAFFTIFLNKGVYDTFNSFFAGVERLFNILLNYCSNMCLNNQDLCSIRKNLLEHDVELSIIDALVYIGVW